MEERIPTKGIFQLPNIPDEYFEGYAISESPLKPWFSYKESFRIKSQVNFHLQTALMTYNVVKNCFVYRSQVIGEPFDKLAQFEEYYADPVLTPEGVLPLYRIGSQSPKTWNWQWVPKDG